jgi:hypothetical protein
MPSPSPQPPSAFVDSSFISNCGTTSFQLPSSQVSKLLLANNGLAELYKIFGVRATLLPAKDGGDLVDILLTGNKYYAVLAQRWMFARVAPECVMRFQFSSSQVS